MVNPILPPKGGIPYLINTPSKTAIQKFVVRIDISTAGCPMTVYVMHREFNRGELLQVLAEVKQRHPCVTVSAVGCEVAAFSHPDKSR